MKKICSLLLCTLMLMNLAIGTGAVESIALPDAPENEISDAASGDLATSQELLPDKNVAAENAESSEIALAAFDDSEISSMTFASNQDLSAISSGGNGYTVVSSENPISEPLDPSNVETINLQMAEQEMRVPAALSENQAPVGTPELIIKNADSIKDGCYTTASEFVIVTNYNGQDLVYDPEGGPISLVFNSSFPGGYIETYDDGTYQGFKVHMFNVGAYVLNFAFTDQVGDMSANMWTMNFDIIRRGDYKIFEDSFSSAADVNEYPITVDFSKESSYSVGIMRTGTCGGTMEALDAAGNSAGSTYFTSQSYSQEIAKNIILKRPTGAADVCNYTIRVTTKQDYFDKSSDISDTRYQIAYGGISQAKYFFEDVSSNTKVHHYTTKREDLQYSNTYEYIADSVSDYGNWYKMVAQGTETVTLAINKTNKINFRIVDVNTMQTLYDNAGSGYFQPDELGGYFTKAEINFTAGQAYYIVVYALNPEETSVITYNVSVGQRRAMFKANKYTIPQTNMVAGQSYVWTFTIEPPFGKDAYAHKIYFSGSSASWAIEGGYYQVQRPGVTTWQQNSPKFYPDISYNFTSLTSPLVPATGTWKLRINCVKSGVYPSNDLRFHYYYLF